MNRLKVIIVNRLLAFRYFQKIIGGRWYARWSGKYILAEKELAILPKILGNDSIVFDIGANRGEIAFYLSAICKARKVYAFEPQDKMFGVLSGMAKNLKNVFPFKIAFSDSAGNKTLHIPLKNGTQYTQEASLQDIDKNNDAESVETDTIDNFVAKNKIEILDFLKCDTEGHELMVFTGGQKTLGSLRPLVYVEIKDSNKKALFDLFRRYDYTAFEWRESSSTLIKVTDSQQNGTQNYYFLPNEKNYNS